MPPLPQNRAQRRAQKRALRRSGAAVGLSMLATTGLLGAYLGNPRLGRSYAAAPVQCGADVTGSGTSGSNAASTALLNAAIDDFVSRVNSCDMINITGGFEVVDSLHSLGTSKIDLVDSTLTIQGNGHEITGGSTYRGLVGFVKGGITISDLTMRGFVWSAGDVTNFGGAVYNYWDLAATDSTFASNSAPFGGGVASKGTVTLTDSYLGDNHSLNNGGAVWGKAVSISGSTFSGNTSDAGGAGGAAWANEGPVTVSNSYLVGNYARLGGAVTSGGSASSITVTGSTFAFNASAEHGGAIDASYTTTLAVTNSTFYANTAGGDGGAIRAQRGAAVTFSTFTQNDATGSGGGIWWAYPYTTTVSNSIMWANTATAGADAYGTCYKTVCSELAGSYSSFTSNSSVFTLAAGGLGTITGDPKLGELGDNGGFTVPGSPAFTIPTAQPADDSPVVRAANPVQTGFPATDQRGTGFPRTGGAPPGRADMGAVQSVQTITVAPNPASATITWGAATPTFGFAATIPGPVAFPGPWVTQPTCAVGGPITSAVLGAGAYEVVCSGGDAGPGTTVTYVPGTLTVAKVTPTVKYTGTKVQLLGDPLTLSSTVTPVGCTGPATYSLTTDPTGGTTVPFPLTGPTVPTVGWLAGTYTVTVAYPGDANCNPATGTGTIRLAATQEVEGEGYHMSQVGKAKFDFEIEDPAENSYHPEPSYITWASSTWKFNGLLSTTWTKSGGYGTGTGTGSLYRWEKSGRSYRWVLKGSNVPVTIRFSETVERTRLTSGTPGTFVIGFTGAGFPQLPLTNAPLLSGEIEYELEGD